MASQRYVRTAWCCGRELALCLPQRYRVKSTAIHIVSTSARPYSNQGKIQDDVQEMFAEPSWSVKALLTPPKDSLQEPLVTKETLHHLLRLSALPVPDSVAKGLKMTQGLESQLRFVQAVQNIDTEGVEPLQSIRDETKQAEREGIFTIKSLREEFEKEEVVGKRGRIVRKKNLPDVDEDHIEGWDPLAQAPKKLGRFFVVETNKD